MVVFISMMFVIVVSVLLYVLIYWVLMESEEELFFVGICVLELFVYIFWRV